MSDKLDRLSRQLFFIITIPYHVLITMTIIRIASMYVLDCTCSSRIPAQFGAVVASLGQDCRRLNDDRIGELLEHRRVVTRMDEEGAKGESERRGGRGKRKSVASDWITVRESQWTRQMTGTNCPSPPGILIYPVAIELHVFSEVP